MNIIFKCAVIGIVASVFVLILKKKNGEYSLLLVLASSIIIFMLVASDIYYAISDISDLWDNTGIDSSYFKILLKSLGICLIAEFSADVCSDFGNKSLANGILLVGKVSILVISLPLMQAILQIVTGLVGQ